MNAQYWFLLLTLAVSACATAGGTQTATEPALPVPDISNLKPQWIAGDCRSMAIDAVNHKTCIAYLASQLPPFDPQRREYFGEQYSPHKFLECALKQPKGVDGACEKYRLRRVENPEYWPYPDVPKPKWPDTPKESVYKPGMSSKAYFEALCKAEAGEFIYKTVNVEGVYQVRPRQSEESNERQFDRYTMEDPYDYTQAMAERAPFYFVGPDKYLFFETPSQIYGNYSTKYYDESMSYKPGYDEFFARYMGNDHRNFSSMKKEFDQKLKGRYGYTWRGISRPHDREMGIGGGELIIVDLQTNEILGLRRGFARSVRVTNSPTGIAWKLSEVCPKYGVKPRKNADGSYTKEFGVEGGYDKDFDFEYWFISKVLRPLNQSNNQEGVRHE